MKVQVTDLDGKTHSLSDFRGKKVLLVARHFPSRAELIIVLNQRFFAPLFEALSEAVLGQITVMERIEREPMAGHLTVLMMKLELLRLQSLTKDPNFDPAP
mgnify:CR=1 FL=1